VLVQVENLDKFMAAFTAFPEEMARACRRAVKAGLGKIQLEASTNHSYISRTGDLDRAYRTVVSKDGLVGELFLDGRVSGAAAYAAIQHEGGTIPADKVVPKTRKYMRQISNGKFISKRAIKRDIVIKGGHFLTNAATKLQDEVLEDISKAIGKAIKKVGL
jgi:hypothetical protein